MSSAVTMQNADNTVRFPSDCPLLISLVGAGEAGKVCTLLSHVSAEANQQEKTYNRNQRKRKPLEINHTYLSCRLRWACFSLSSG